MGLHPAMAAAIGQRHERTPWLLPALPCRTLKRPLAPVLCPAQIFLLLFWHAYSYSYGAASAALVLCTCFHHALLALQKFWLIQ